MQVQHSNKVLQENIKRIVAEQSHIIEQLKEDKEKLKKEIFNLNDDVINSLRQERDDFLESKQIYVSGQSQKVRTNHC